jgi:hypothetical protein
MSNTWTAEQILGLAPDPASAKAGRGLASAGKWVTLGASERALWGECQGSGRQPYQTQIDLVGPAFNCSCPSRKFPCKHGLGLFLIFSSQPGSFGGGPAPAWVEEWLAKREAKARPRPEQPAEEDEATRERKAAAQARRAGQRQERIAAGLADLERWLRDLVRQGLSTAPERPARYWTDVAARLVDAQAPGAARLVRELAPLPASGEGWPGRLLAQLGRIALLIEGYRRIESLPPELQEDVRAQLGLTYDQDELQRQPGLRDRWCVVGQRLREEERLVAQRSWLIGQTSGRAALVLHFAPVNQPLRSELMAGACFEGELSFFPSSHPLRAIVRERAPSIPAGAEHAGHATIEDFLSTCAAALSQNPWLEELPCMLHGAIPTGQEQRWAVVDSAGATLPLSCHDDQGWKLVALGGGRPLSIFGEWDGRVLIPLSAWAEGRYVRL